MGRFILAVIAFAMVLAVLKMVIAALLIAGLIFRTKETIGILLMFGLFAVFRAQPLAGLALTAVIIVVVVIMKKREARSGSQPEQDLVPIGQNEPGHE